MLRPVRSYLIQRNIPEGLNNKPELSIDVDTTTSGPRELVISYLADGFSWAADYRLGYDQ